MRIALRLLAGSGLTVRQAYEPEKLTFGRMTGRRSDLHRMLARLPLLEQQQACRTGEAKHMRSPGLPLSEMVRNSRTV